MRIAYFISSFSSAHTGTGGHYESLREVSDQIAKSDYCNQVMLCSVGNLPVPALERAGSEQIRINLGCDSNFISSLKSARLKLLAMRPTHVHAFDNKSLSVARLLTAGMSPKEFLTKPGGPNPAPGRFPRCPDVITFSEENAEYLRETLPAKQSRVHLVSNRISTPACDLERIKLLRSMAQGSEIVMRIARIGEYYESSLRQTLKLAAFMRQSGRNVRAFLIGVCQSNEVYNRLMSEKHEDDVILVDPNFTRSAAELLPAAAFAVGTGRGVIESLLMDVPAFAPVSNWDLPRLVNHRSWPDLVRKNFSERNSTVSDPSREIERVMRMSPPELRSMVSETRLLAYDRYSSDLIASRYKDIYDTDQRVRTPIYDIAKVATATALAAIRSSVK